MRANESGQRKALNTSDCEAGHLGSSKAPSIENAGGSLLPFLFSNPVNKLYSLKEANGRGLLCAHLRVCQAGNGVQTSQKSSLVLTSWLVFDIQGLIDPVIHCSARQVGHPRGHVPSCLSGPCHVLGLLGLAKFTHIIYLPRWALGFAVLFYKSHWRATERGQPQCPMCRSP